jgi:hypothetical protein
MFVAELGGNSPVYRKPLKKKVKQLSVAIRPGVTPWLFPHVG